MEEPLRAHIQTYVAVIIKLIQEDGSKTKEDWTENLGTLNRFVHLLIFLSFDP